MKRPLSELEVLACLTSKEKPDKLAKTVRTLILVALLPGSFVLPLSCCVGNQVREVSTAEAFDDWYYKPESIHDRNTEIQLYVSEHLYEFMPKPPVKLMHAYSIEFEYRGVTFSFNTYMQVVEGELNVLCQIVGPPDPLRFEFEKVMRIPVPKSEHMTL